MKNLLSYFFNEENKQSGMADFAQKHPIQTALSVASVPLILILLRQEVNPKIGLTLLLAMNGPSLKAALDDTAANFDPNELFPGMSI